jgi:K+-transporting ATPase ATPase C chain
MIAKALLTELRGALLGTLVLALVCCGLYPLAVYGIAQAAFPHKANGSLLRNAAGGVCGSGLLAQAFTNAVHFHPRPSAAGAGYDAAASGGSNLGPTSQKLRDMVRDRLAAYRAANGLTGTVAVPADAITASGSGLDPHISPRNAELQAARVARARGWDVTRVNALVRESTEPPQLGVLGDARVNVLRLNLALDAASAGR